MTSLIMLALMFYGTCIGIALILAGTIYFLYRTGKATRNGLQNYHSKRVCNRNGGVL